MVRLPPALFGPLRQAAERAEAARRYWAMVEGSEMLGVKVTWKGSTPEPKSDWDYDYSERQRYIQALGEQAGILQPVRVADQLAADRAAWLTLRARRRGLA